MRDTAISRRRKSEVLFQKILDDPWACNKLFHTFCDYLFITMIPIPVFHPRNLHRHYLIATPTKTYLRF